METTKEGKNVLSDTGESKDRQGMIDKIYRYISTQKVSYRCNNCDREYVVKGDCNQCFEGFSFTCNEIKENNQVMIGDVLDYYENDIDRGCEDTGAIIFNKREQYREDFSEFAKLREEKRKPIEEQDIECIRYVYELLSE